MSQGNEKHAGSNDSREEVVDIVDLEEYARAGKAPPRAKQYRIKIDTVQYVVDRPSMTGREILALAGKTPETYLLRERIHGGGTQPIEPTQVVEFTKPGVERFVTMPRDQTDGGR
jgi:hypothetical protein